jgi:hypothetical protein
VINPNLTQDNLDLQNAFGILNYTISKLNGIPDEKNFLQNVTTFPPKIFYYIHHFLAAVLMALRDIFRDMSVSS